MQLRGFSERWRPHGAIKQAGNGPEEENIISIRNKNTLPPPSPAGFDDWYSVYPRKKEPQAAKKAFAKAINNSLIALPALMEKTRAFAASWAAHPKEDRRFIPYPASWLNAGGYDDEPDGGESAPAPIDPLSFTDDDWRRRLIYFRDADKWLDAWGPKPGEPGCLVPSHLIVTPVSSAKGAA